MKHLIALSALITAIAVGCVTPEEKQHRRKMEILLAKQDIEACKHEENPPECLIEVRWSREMLRRCGRMSYDRDKLTCYSHMTGRGGKLKPRPKTHRRYER